MAWHGTMCMQAGVNLYNPSLDLVTMVKRLRDVGQKAVIAVAPAVDLHQHAPRQARSSSSPPDRDQESNGEGKAGVEQRHDGEEKGEGEGHGGGGPERGDGRGRNRERVDAEAEGLGLTLAAQEFSAWLVDELGGPDRWDRGAWFTATRSRLLLYSRILKVKNVFIDWCLRYINGVLSLLCQYQWANSRRYYVIVCVVLMS